MKTFKRTLKNQRQVQAGFTIIELMIATAVFTTILLILTTSLFDITNYYYKGITQTNTQNVARDILNTVSQDIEFNGSFPIKTANNVDGTQGYCIGDQLISFLPGYEVENPPDLSGSNSHEESYHGFVISNVGSCNNTTTPLSLYGNNGMNLPSGDEELLYNNMRIANFSINEVGTDQYLWRIDARVVYGSTDLINHNTGPTAACLGTAGSQFCAVSELSTIVQMRVQ